MFLITKNKILFFRVADGICFVHEESTAAIVQLLQMQLLNLYPKYRFTLLYFIVNSVYLVFIFQLFYPFYYLFTAQLDMKHYTLVHLWFT